MSNVSQPEGTPTTSPSPVPDADPGPIPRPTDRSWNGYGIASLGLATGAFVTAPFLLLLPVVGVVPTVLAAGGGLLACIGLSRKDRRPGLAVAGLIVSAVLFGLTLSIAMLWTQLVIYPATRDYPELREVMQEVIDYIKRLILPDTGVPALLGLLAGALLVAGGVLLRRRGY
ncbi:LPXTG cell wall anchor domain-containing protein [Rubrobacter tropicus]|uniref:LPXTG cell wall anchor domain-containing protein n=1 Tax=Rubrobacter tropicus TaxID=2653851 RepID=A0A6G8QEB1_9ACTN|nr:LPXTG cell wall anchor domain-containing protein [Rubrobacter tropicus]QIN84577.1 LPXTG cell wall anchor domain-containing protein [Rubrobacter tropicus]